MATLRPYPFRGLVTRIFRELRDKEAIFDLSARRFFPGSPDRDLSVRFHGRRASSPLGPAAGPHTQMAQNIALSWLGGCRIFELKTVQILDELAIPRPCIDMQTIGYNVEWSQELKLEESLEEYVKGAMLVRILAEGGTIECEPGFGDAIFDMSVGYDLEGIRSPRVLAFMRGMLDCRDTVERLRAQIPPELGRLRDLDFPARLSDSVTLSTFHGCPPDEIEGIIDFLLRELGVHCIIKLNPTLLGREEVCSILNDRLGYEDVRVPEDAFERDTTWEQMVGFVSRLKETADGLGLGLGVKFTNTLIVDNHRDFFPSEERQMYLSGPPLHALAMRLVARFRERFGGDIPISFSAGIDRRNFPDAVALGLVPVTVCSDLLKPGGYGRLPGYLEELTRRMGAAGAATIDDFVIRAHGNAGAALDEVGVTEGTPLRKRLDGAVAEGAGLREAAGDELLGKWLSAVRCLNAAAYARSVIDEPRYAREKNRKLPRKIGSRLALFDCITCDKCVPVCPNDANFTFTLPPAEIPRVRLLRRGDRWETEEHGTIVIAARHQIGNFADLCNDCGNCDVFCPEDGGPYKIKPRFFGTREGWADPAAGDGFFIETQGERVRVAGRFEGNEFHAAIEDGRVDYSGDGFAIRFDPRDPPGTAKGEASVPVDLTWFRILDLLQRSILSASEVNYISCRG